MSNFKKCVELITFPLRAPIRFKARSANQIIFILFQVVWSAFKEIFDFIRFNLLFKTEVEKLFRMLSRLAVYIIYLLLAGKAKPILISVKRSFHYLHYFIDNNGEDNSMRVNNANNIHELLKITLFLKIIFV